MSDDDRPQGSNVSPDWARLGQLPMSRVSVYGCTGPQGRAKAYDLLALAAGEVWGLDQLPPIDRRPGGKPFFPSAPGLEFNLSHSGPLTLCALADTPVGADIQRVKVLRPGLLPRVCSHEELAWLECQSDLWASFAVLWALKESRAKWSGSGLTQPISSIAIPIPADGPGLYSLGELWFRLYTGSDWAAAVCSRSRPQAEIQWRVPPLKGDLFHEI